jgi:NAD(P)-dependent dehydrogenase (short-subunit alcohol dehydrogenase family)
LQGNVAVVLGAAGKDNMAQVIARRFVAEGAKLAAAGRDLAALTAFAEPLGGIALACDITSKAEVDGLADSAVAHFGRVDIAVNATGWGFLAQSSRRAKPIWPRSSNCNLADRSASCRRWFGQ